jgi:alkyl hydroperoxide reductase subunit AhpC
MRRFISAVAPERFRSLPNRREGAVRSATMWDKERQSMLLIGHRAPRFRVPALRDGALTYLDSAGLRGRWVVLCCLPRLSLVEATIVDRQAATFADYRAEFLAVAPDDRTLRRPWLVRLGALRAPLLVDPLRRLHRAYGLVQDQTLTRCRTFLIDPDGLLRFHLVHDLTGRGLGAIMEILRLFQHQRTAAWTPSCARRR